MGVEASSALQGRWEDVGKMYFGGDKHAAALCRWVLLLEGIIYGIQARHAWVTVVIASMPEASCLPLALPSPPHTPSPTPTHHPSATQ